MHATVRKSVYSWLSGATLLLLSQMLHAQAPETVEEAKPLAPDPTLGFVNEFDTDGNGKLSDLERQKAIKALDLHQEANLSKRSGDIFVEFDGDRNNQLSPSETKELIDSLGRYVSGTKKKTRRAFNPLDGATAIQAARAEEVKEMREDLAKSFDTDGDSIFTLKEKNNAMAALRGEVKSTEGRVGMIDEAKLGRLIVAFDTDGSGKISSDERQKALKYIENQFGISNEERARMQDVVIKEFDLDNDWRLSREERLAAGRALRGEVDLEEAVGVRDRSKIRLIIEAFDVDQTGTLSTTERAIAMRNADTYFTPVPLVVGNSKKKKAKPGSTFVRDDNPKIGPLDPEGLASEFFEEHDANSNTELSRDELVAAIKKAVEDGIFPNQRITMASLRGARIAKIQNLRGEMIKFFDRNGDDNLSREEKLFTMNALRGDLRSEMRVGAIDDEKVKLIVAAFDQDGNGQLSTTERGTALRIVEQHFESVPIIDPKGSDNNDGKKGKKLKPLD